MRSLQAYCEARALEVRTGAALHVSAQALTSARWDELYKLKGQLARATLQVRQHIEAQEYLKKQVTHWTDSFQTITSSEMEGRAATQQEVAQLREVVKDLQERI